MVQVGQAHPRLIQLTPETARDLLPLPADRVTRRHFCILAMTNHVAAFRANNMQISMRMRINQVAYVILIIHA